MHTSSNFFGEVPHPSEYKVPRTVEEFEVMGYRERLWLLKNYPAIYERYTKQLE